MSPGFTRGRTGPGVGDWARAVGHRRKPRQARAGLAGRDQDPQSTLAVATSSSNSAIDTAPETA